MAHPKPANVVLSTHPLLKTKLSLLRSASTPSVAVRSLTDEISAMLAYEATKDAFKTQATGGAMSSLNVTYTAISTVETAVVVPILRSGLQMVNAFLSLLPSETSVHHLGIFRDKHTLAPVEYYNKLPPLEAREQVDIAFVVDPIIATGGTAATAVAVLKEWGVKKIIYTSILASTEGLERAANEWPEGTVFHVGSIDPGLNDKGYIIPGMGDIGDRLFGTN